MMFLVSELIDLFVKRKRQANKTVIVHVISLIYYKGHKSVSLQ